MRMAVKNMRAGAYSLNTELKFSLLVKGKDIPVTGHGGP
jgi:hypothetical protein